MSACRPTVVMSSLEPPLRLRLGAAALAVDRQRAPQEVLDPVGRVQRAEGVLEDHLQLRAERPRRLEPVALEDVDAVDQDLRRSSAVRAGRRSGRGCSCRDPDSPTRATISPRPMVRSTPCRARTRVAGRRAANREGLSQSADLEGRGAGVGHGDGVISEWLIVRLLPGWRRSAAGASAPTRSHEMAGCRLGEVRDVPELHAVGQSRQAGPRGPVSGGNAPISAWV